MKWFKHLSTSLKDSFIFELIENFGGDGYLVFFGTLEMMSDEFNVDNPGVNRLSIKKMTSIMQVSRQKLVKILSFCDQTARKNISKDISFFVDIEKNHVVIKCNKLASLCDEHTQKILKNNRESIGSQSGVTPAIEEEAEEEVDKEIKEPEPFRLPSKDQIENGSEKLIMEQIEKAAKELYDKKIWKDVYAFKNKMLKQDHNKKAILYILTRVLLRNPVDPWAYAQEIMKKEDGNFNARDYEKNQR